MTNKTATGVEALPTSEAGAKAPASVEALCTCGHPESDHIGPEYDCVRVCTALTCRHVPLAGDCEWECVCPCMEFEDSGRPALRLVALAPVQADAEPATPTPESGAEGAAPNPETEASSAGPGGRE